MSCTESTHLYLISAQATPNITPAIDMRPKRVIMLVSVDMQQQSDWLESVLKPRGIKIERWPIEDPWDIESIQTSVLELLEQERQNGIIGKIALNSTGGTKPMSIAAYEAFRAYDLPIFYVHPERDRLTWLHPAERPAQELANRIKLDSFLLAHGSTIETSPPRNVPEIQQLDLANTIVENIRCYQTPLGEVNRLASQARGSLVSPRVNGRTDELDNLIALFADHGFLELQNSKLRFPNEASRNFVNGGWIEPWVFDQVRRLRQTDSNIQDCAYNVEIYRTQHGKRVPNEIDVAFLRDNRLHIIECKTARFTGRDREGASSALYKLDTLRQLVGGQKARALLVSYRNLPDYDLNRAREFGVHVCAGRQLLEFRHCLGQFVA